MADIGVCHIVFFLIEPLGCTKLFQIPHIVALKYAIDCVGWLEGESIIFKSLINSLTTMNKLHTAHYFAHELFDRCLFWCLGRLIKFDFVLIWMDIPIRSHHNQNMAKIKSQIKRFNQLNKSKQALLLEIKTSHHCKRGGLKKCVLSRRKPIKHGDEVKKDKAWQNNWLFTKLLSWAVIV